MIYLVYQALKYFSFEGAIVRASTSLGWGGRRAPSKLKHFKAWLTNPEQWIFLVYPQTLVSACHGPAPTYS